MLKDIQQSIRLFKNDIIQKYYQIRVKKIQDPYHILLRKYPYRILFIISHMRSGSSLLTHILNSNPEIIGYGETHLQYSSEANFKNLILKVYWQAQEFRKIQHLKNLNMNHQYVMDKVLHNNKFLNNNFLNSENIYGLFLIREPQRSLTSILDLKPHWDEVKALKYYVERLKMLENYAKVINTKKRSFFMTHDQLLNHTDLVFEALKNFLETKKGFSEEYEILKTTGMRDVGDHRGNIKAGRIVRVTRKLDIKISPELVEKARQSYNQCYATLSQYCSSIESKI